MGQFRKAVDVGPVSKAPVSSLHQIPLNSIKRSDYMLVGKLRDISNRMRRMASGEPSVYVSTYKKYSEGSLQGKWLNLDRFDSRKEFLAACRELHKDEADPELMFQDFENFPEAFYGESALADALWEWLELAKYEREAVSAYLSQNDFDLKVSDILGGFLDTASSMEEFVSEHYQPENLSPSVLSHYLVITPADIRVIAGEEASSRVDSMSDTEILKEARMADEYESEDDPRKRVAILERARDEVASDVSEEIQRQLKRDPLDYFSDIMGYDAHAVLENNLMSFDYPAFTRDLKRGFVDGDVVDFISYDGKIFVFSWI
jgi:antirestriction protein